MVLYGNGKSNMVVYGMYDLVWFCLVMCGLVWPFAAMHNFCACFGFKCGPTQSSYIV